MTDLITPILDAFKHAPPESNILGDLHPADIGQPWMNRNTYQFYWSIGRAFHPESYLEIGVRFGYSIQSIAMGSGRLKTVYGFDSEYDLAGSLDIAHTRLRMMVDELSFTRADTQTLSAIHVQPVDMAHIDGMHTEQGVYHDCELAIHALKPGGIMLIDDVGGDAGREVRSGALRFCEDRGLTPHYLHCFHGMYLVRKA